LWRGAHNEKLGLKFREEVSFGCSLTLAGFGYPYISVQGPALPVTVMEAPTCDLWWNEVTENARGQLVMTGHRIADVVAVAGTIAEAVQLAYQNIRKLKCLSSYYRTDVGASLWPPGAE
jgi:phosphoribosylamine-glycine ligase